MRQLWQQHGCGNVDEVSWCCPRPACTRSCCRQVARQFPSFCLPDALPNFAKAHNPRWHLLWQQLALAALQGAMAMLSTSNADLAAAAISCPGSYGSHPPMERRDLARQPAPPGGGPVHGPHCGVGLVCGLYLQQWA